MRRTIGLATLYFFSFCIPAFCAPYNGQIMERTQPDGTAVLLKGYGDEYYGWFESLDGFTVVRDPQTGWFCFAELSEDGSDLISTGVSVGHEIETTIGLHKKEKKIAADKTIKEEIKIKTDFRVKKIKEKQKLLYGDDIQVINGLPYTASTSESTIYDSQPAATPQAALAAPGTLPPTNNLSDFTGTIKGLVLIFDFSDAPASYTIQQYQDKVNKTNFYDASGNARSLRTYFEDVSRGVFIMDHFVYGIYRAPQTFAYYDSLDYTEGARQLLSYGLNDLKDNGFDFSQLSTNASGEIRALAVMYTGHPAAWAEGMWYHAGWWGGFSADGVKTGSYCTDDAKTLDPGTLIHEHGHMAAKWPDTYSYIGGTPGTWGVMGGGYCDLPNPYFLYENGWLDGVNIKGIPAQYTMDSTDPFFAYFYYDPDQPTEFYMIRPYSTNLLYCPTIPDQGMTFWRINTEGNNAYYPNTDRHIELVHANNIDTNSTTNVCFKSGGLLDRFTSYTTPSTDWKFGVKTGQQSGMDITNISSPGNEMTFYTFVPDLVGHYRFEDNLNDSSGFGYDGTAGGSITYSSGQANQALDLDGISDFITLPSGGLANIGDMTVAAWIYWDGGADSGQRIFDFGSSASQYLFLTPRSNTNELQFTIRNGNKSMAIEAPELPAGQWSHVAVTLDGDIGTLYVNGAPAASNPSMTIDPFDFQPVNNYIGTSQSTSDSFFDGQIDDFRIYNYALSGDEITRLSLSFTSNLINNLDGLELASYNGQSLADYVDIPFGGLTYSIQSGPDWLTVDSDGTLSGMPKALDEGENVFTVRVQEDTLGQFDTAQMTIQVDNIFNGTQGMIDLLGFADQWLMTDCTDTPACGGADLDGFNDVNFSDFLILAHNWLVSENLQLWLTFDEMSGDVAYDGSIYRRNGSLLNSPIRSAGADGGALAFDGSNYVEVAHDATLDPEAGSFSVAFWMKSDTPSQGALMVSKRGSAPNYSQYMIGLSNGTPTLFSPGRKLTFLLKADNGNLKGGYTTNDIVFSEWTHVCFALDQDADTAHIYIDGVSVPVTITTNKTLSTINTGAPVYIGQNPALSSKAYNGLIDDVRIYDKAVTELEIQEMTGF